jgi:F0F1-type ATP synthase membrane subunit c/vacuolar-type H+-ATPase subunit K
VTGVRRSATLLLVLAAAGLSAVGLSFVLKPAMLARAAAQRRPDVVTTAYVLAFALCESCALFGLMGRFMTGAREAFYFFVPSALGMLLHFPRRRHLDDAAGDAAQTFKTTF